MLSMLLAARPSRSLIAVLAHASQPFGASTAVELQTSPDSDSICSCSYTPSPTLLAGGRAWHQDSSGPFAAAAAFAGQQLRGATKKAGGAASQKQDSHAKNLGVKMLGGELIFPGQIIVRQRGLRYHPGYSVGLGKDHTIFATGVGFVYFHQEKVSMGPDGDITKKRMYISVTPVDGNWDKQHRSELEAKMIARRAAYKREALRGRPFEPALFYSRPRPEGQPFSWLTRPPVRARPAPQAAAASASGGKASSSSSGGKASSSSTVGTARSTGGTPHAAAAPAAASTAL